MPMPPGVLLTATLQDTSGNAVALSALRITLCYYGTTIPRIAGTSVLAKIRQDIKLVNGAIPGAGLPLWGNYQIFPGGTFYEIAVIDDKNNVVQAGNYAFGVAGTFDLSSLAQVYPPGTSPVPPTPPPVPNIILQDTVTATVYTLFSAIGQLMVTVGGTNPVPHIVLSDTSEFQPWTVAITNGQLIVSAGGANPVTGIELADTITFEMFLLQVMIVGGLATLELIPI